MLTAKQVGSVEGRAMNPPSLQDLALQASQLTAPSAASAAGQAALSHGHGSGEISSQKTAKAVMGFASQEVPDAVMPKTIAAAELGQQASADPGVLDMSLGPAFEPHLSGISITESSPNGVLTPIGPLSTAPTSSVAMLGLSAPLTGLSAQTTINMQDANWPAQLGQELVQLRQAGEQALKVVLAPEHLGHMELELRQLSDGSLELRMQAENSSARDLLLAQSSELREKLHNQGMSLSHFSCSSQEQRDSTRRQESGEGQGLAEAASDGADKDTSPAGHIAAVSSAGLHLYA
nr:flagellar hook-length control protein FliK [Oceanococcus sp. HetDA_MAG_MS8]